MPFDFRPSHAEAVCRRANRESPIRFQSARIRSRAATIIRASERAQTRSAIPRPLLRDSLYRRFTAQERHDFLMDESRELCDRAERAIAGTAGLVARLRLEAERREAF